MQLSASGILLMNQQCLSVLGMQHPSSLSHTLPPGKYTEKNNQVNHLPFVISDRKGLLRFSQFFNNC